MDVSSLRIGNAAGIVKTLEDVRRFAKVPSSTQITAGSVTVEPREGNSGSREYLVPGGPFFNSLGMPNGGLPYYQNMVAQMQQVVTMAEKKLCVSIAGFSVRDYRLLAVAVGPHVDALEANYGCPNVWGGGTQKNILSFDPRGIEEVTAVIAGALEAVDSPAKLAVKLSPYSDPGLLAEVAAVIAGNLHVSSVVLSNTVPNALPLRDDGSRAIFGKGYAGMSGQGYKWFVLGQVAQFRELLPDRVSITAVGGISSGLDIRDYESVGATEFQVGAACYLGGEKVLHTIAAEYADLVC